MRVTISSSYIHLPPHWPFWNHLIDLNNPRSINSRTSNLTRIGKLLSTPLHNHRDRQTLRKLRRALERERSAEIRHAVPRAHVRDGHRDREILAREIDDGVCWRRDSAGHAIGDGLVLGGQVFADDNQRLECRDDFADGGKFCGTGTGDDDGLEEGVLRWHLRQRRILNRWGNWLRRSDERIHTANAGPSVVRNGAAEGIFFWTERNQPTCSASWARTDPNRLTRGVSSPASIAKTVCAMGRTPRTTSVNVCAKVMALRKSLTGAL